MASYLVPLERDVYEHGPLAIRTHKWVDDDARWNVSFATSTDFSKARKLRDNLNKGLTTTYGKVLLDTWLTSAPPLPQCATDQLKRHMVDTRIFLEDLMDRAPRSVHAIIARATVRTDERVRVEYPSGLRTSDKHDLLRTFKPSKAKELRRENKSLVLIWRDALCVLIVRRSDDAVLTRAVAWTAAMVESMLWLMRGAPLWRVLVSAESWLDRRVGKVAAHDTLRVRRALFASWADARHVVSAPQQAEEVCHHVFTHAHALTRAGTPTAWCDGDLIEAVWRLGILAWDAQHAIGTDFRNLLRELTTELVSMVKHEELEDMDDHLTQCVLGGGPPPPPAALEGAELERALSAVLCAKRALRERCAESGSLWHKLCTVTASGGGSLRAQQDRAMWLHQDGRHEEALRTLISVEKERHRVWELKRRAKHAFRLAQTRRFLARVYHDQGRREEEHEMLIGALRLYVEMETRGLCAHGDMERIDEALASVRHHTHATNTQTHT